MQYYKQPLPVCALRVPCVHLLVPAVVLLRVPCVHLLVPAVVLLRVPCVHLLVPAVVLLRPPRCFTTAPDMAQLCACGVHAGCVNGKRAAGG
jgi:hypothetical protein